MSSIQLQIYDFAMAAGGSFPLPVAGSYFRLLTTTGDVDVVGDTFGRLGPINRGQGLADKQYGRLTIQDRSGAPNAGTILVSDANFIDQTLFGSISLAGAVALDAATLAALEKINVIPETYDGAYKSITNKAANTPEAVFLAAANTNGAYVWSLQSVATFTATGFDAFVAGAAPPTTVIDGDVILQTDSVGVGGTNNYSMTLPKPVFIPAGKGLHYISQQPHASCLRSGLFTLL